MRDPLNLKSVKPEQPLAVETSKDQLQTPAQSAAALNATSEEMALEEQPQQQGNSNKRFLIFLPDEFNALKINNQSTRLIFWTIEGKEKRLNL